MKWRTHAARVLSALSGISNINPVSSADIDTAARLNGFTVANVGVGHFRVTRLADNLSTVTASATEAVEWMKEHAQ